MTAEEIKKVDHHAKVRVFIDFWNFQLHLNEVANDPFYRIDWEKLSPWIANLAGELALGGPGADIRFEGSHIHMSYNARTPQGKKLKHWAYNVLDRFPGVELTCKERKSKSPPKCPECHELIEECPHCGAKMIRTVEKGIDTGIVTDMIRLAWENAYDIAVLVSTDRDYIPAVQFLQEKGKRIINATFPPKGMSLARACWASIDLSKHLEDFSRSPN